MMPFQLILSLLLALNIGIVKNLLRNFFRVLNPKVQYDMAIISK